MSGSAAPGYCGVSPGSEDCCQDGSKAMSRSWPNSPKLILLGQNVHLKLGDCFKGQWPPFFRGRMELRPWWGYCLLVRRKVLPVVIVPTRQNGELLRRSRLLKSRVARLIPTALVPCRRLTRTVIPPARRCCLSVRVTCFLVVGQASPLTPSLCDCLVFFLDGLACRGVVEFSFLVRVRDLSPPSPSI